MRYDSWKLKKQGRIQTDGVEIYNVVAVLPGTTNKDEVVVISGHYDSLGRIVRPGQTPLGPGETPPGAGNDQQAAGGQQRAAGGGGAAGGAGGARGGGGQRPQGPPPDPNIVDAPGVTDDGSGTACVMELARVMSQYEWDKTIVFVTFAGEEQGLLGATLFAEKAAKEHMKIEAVLNNDIIGSDVAGNGAIDNRRLNVFSEDPNDSTSRNLARYIKDIGERYVPGVKVDLVFRADRFGRGGDHSALNMEGFAAVRFSTPEENFANQHTTTDTFANTSVPYTTRVVRVNGAVAASLALGPRAPVVVNQREVNGRQVSTLLLDRGQSRYDARLRWKNDNPEADLLGYVVMIRSTTASFWEREVFVGNVTEYLMPDVSIDDLVFGVKAIDKDGNESLVTSYVSPPRRKTTIEVY